MDRGSRHLPYRLEIMHGGPFFVAQRRIGLVGTESFRTRLRLSIVLSTTFLLPLLICGLSQAGNLQPFLADPGVWAKFVLAPAFFLVAEPQIERAVDRCVVTLFAVPLVSTAGMPGAEAAWATAIRQRNSAVAELVIAALAVAMSGLNLVFLWRPSASAMHWAAAGSAPTPVGYVCLVVGNTLFWFLLFRLVWRHLIWAMFSNSIAKTGLRLVVTHPDGHAGLSFLASCPRGYTVFILGISSVVAAGLARQLPTGTLSIAAFTAICILWLLVVAAFLMLPLTGFVIRIVRLKTETVCLTLGPIQAYERAVEHRALGRNVCADEVPDDRSASAEVGAIYRAAVTCSALLLTRATVMPILASALLPIAAVGLTVFPFSELGPVLKHLLLL